MEEENVCITLTMKAEFLEKSSNLSGGTDSLEHTIKFNIKEPGVAKRHGRKETMTAGEQFGFHMGQLAHVISGFLCDFDPDVSNGFINGAELENMPEHDDD